MEFIIFDNNEHVLILVKLKATGHGGEVYKGLLGKNKGFFLSYLVVQWFMPKKFLTNN